MLSVFQLAGPTINKRRIRSDDDYDEVLVFHQLRILGLNFLVLAFILLQEQNKKFEVQETRIFVLCLL